jgi:hypothetical protein
MNLIDFRLQNVCQEHRCRVRLQSWQNIYSGQSFKSSKALSLDIFVPTSFGNLTIIVTHMGKP